MAPNVCLRLEPHNGAQIEEYRIDAGRVEVRSRAPHNDYESPGSGWRRLTAQQLRTHVERNTAVAQWLKRRLGWRRLLQACVRQDSPDWLSANPASSPALREFNREEVREAAEQ